MKKFIVIKNCEYVEGYLRSGHAEIEIEAENIEEAKEKIKDINWDFADVIVDDYRINDYELSDEEPEILESEE